VTVLIARAGRDQAANVTNRTRVTDVSGAFTERAFPPGEYSVTGSLEGFRTSRRFVTVQSGQPTAAELFMTAVAGQAVTNSRGEFSISVVAGSYDVEIELTGFIGVEHHDVRVSGTSGVWLDSTLRVSGGLNETISVKASQSG
jgi:hypothetical protein